MGKHWLGLNLAIAWLACACGARDHNSGAFVSHDPTDRKTTDGGVPDVDGAVPDPAAPVVQILEPSPAVDPNNDTLITTDSLTLRCHISKSDEKGARDVDQSSVKIQVVGSGDPPKTVSAPVNAVSADEFEGLLNLGELPNGRLRFTCSANDLATKPLTGWANLDTFLDLGPTIEILEPKDGMTYAVKNPVVMKFRVVDAPVREDDTEAAATGLTLSVSGQEFETTESADQPGVYATLVDFDDRSRFPMPPSTAQIVVSAQSHRTPDPGQRRKVVNIQLDSEGPTITVMSPAQAETVRGEVRLVVTITDDKSKVDKDSVVGTINRDLLELKDWSIMDTTYAVRFDTRSFGNELTQITINLTAFDAVGNKGTASHLLRLDNVAPMLSLDPPLIREWQKINSNVACSMPFDPLGTAINDGDTSPTLTLFRVMVQERTNAAPGERYEYLAGVNESSMVLYAQRGDTPLLIDSNQDGKCDEINLDVDDPPQQIALSPVNVRGTSWFAPHPPNDYARPVATGCQVDGTAMTAPDPLCPFNDLTRAVNQDVQGPAPAIYALNPGNGADGECSGTTWNVGNQFSGGGWVCVAARVEDRIHNVGVSPAIRVCYGDMGSPECDPGSMPSCMDDCTRPDDFGASPADDGKYVVQVQ